MTIQAQQTEPAEHSAPVSRDVVMLPVYESKATEEERAATRKHMANQIRVILDQEKLGVPLEHFKIRCGCMKLVHWMYMYRCLYCGVWFCQECAEQHFGMRVPESFPDVQREA